LAGFGFPPAVIVLAVRWYLRFGLSYRDLEELLAERGVEVDHVTLFGWVQRFTPLLIEAARPCRQAASTVPANFGDDDVGTGDISTTPITGSPHRRLTTDLHSGRSTRSGCVVGVSRRSDHRVVGA